MGRFGVLFFFFLRALFFGGVFFFKEFACFRMDFVVPFFKFGVKILIVRAFGLTENGQ